MSAPNPLPTHLYKILFEDPGSKGENLKLPDLDHTDGFIHLSTSEQTPKTADRFFREYFKLYILKISYSKIEDKVKWEDARGHGVFAHAYADDQEGTLKADGVIEEVLTLERKEGHEWDEVISKTIN